MAPIDWQVRNPSGRHRVIVTKALPGERWIEILTAADCRVQVCRSSAVLSTEEIRAALDNRCDGAIGQLTEDWNADLLSALARAGGRAYSNYAVGYDNVDVPAATRLGIPVGNTPGVLTETTAEMAMALTVAAARRIGEAERFLRGGHYHGWLPTLLTGELLGGATLGIIGAGRIGAAYARMMVEGLRMNLVYHDIHPNTGLERSVAAFAGYLKSIDETPVTCHRSDTIEELLTAADCVSIHTVLNDSTHHLINARRLRLMKDTAILVNTSRGAVIDEAALVAHCRRHPSFRAALDVFEHEPELTPGLGDLENVVIVPHIASATRWARQGMAILAATNVASVLQGYPAWPHLQIGAFLGDDPPKAAPSIVNAADLAYPMAGGKLR